MAAHHGIGIEVGRQSPAYFVELEQRFAQHGQLRRHEQAGFRGDLRDVEQRFADIELLQGRAALLRDELSCSPAKLGLVEMFPRFTRSEERRVGKECRWWW